MIWDEAHRQAMFAAAQVHDDLRIDCTRQVDVYRSLRDLRIRVLFRPLRGCAGVYLPADRGASGILIHAGHPSRLQRYTAAHELAHHVFGHGESMDSTASILRSPGSTIHPTERLAEAFAAWFLMPPELVDKLLSTMNVSSPLEAVDIYELALRLGTSYRATCVHLRSLRLLTATQVAEALAVQPRSIKAELAPKHPPKTWRHDVWLVSSASSGESLNASGGDRVVFRHNVGRKAQETLFEAAPRGIRTGDSYQLLAKDWFDVPMATRRTKWDLGFVDQATGATSAAVEVDVVPPTAGLLVDDDHAGAVRRGRVRIAI